MYITDLTHFLDESGAIAPVKGPARAMAQFLVDVVAQASDATSGSLPAPRCFKCKKGAVDAERAHDDAIVWVCPKCRTEGRISNWQGCLWDLRERPPHLLLTNYVSCPLLIHVSMMMEMDHLDIY